VVHFISGVASVQSGPSYLGGVGQQTAVVGEVLRAGLAAPLLAPAPHPHRAAVCADAAVSACDGAGLGSSPDIQAARVSRSQTGRSRRPWQQPRDTGRAS
jgi:hypothetical protein